MRAIKGFTLIELMIVVAIIAILATIAYPSYVSQVRKSNRADARSSLLRMADLQERYYLQNNTYATQANIAQVGGSGTPEGLYTLSITNANASSYTLSATAAVGSTQLNDAGCTTITLNSAGVKTPATCW